MSGLDLDNLEVAAQLQGILSTYSPDTVPPPPDGVLSFTYQLVVELVRDCQTKYNQGRITSSYLEDLHKNIRVILQQAEEKSQNGDLALINQLAQKFLEVVGRPAHSLEHLETVEGDSRDGQELNPDSSDHDNSQLGPKSDLTKDTAVPPNPESGKCDLSENNASGLIRSLPALRKPCKSDYETSKLISSGAYGAVYLVRHKNTQQIFAMKKMDKQNLIPRRLKRAFLERDILIFAECPFVVSMFCSFPSKHHLCMVMEYVGGGDCGSLLKTRGPLSVTLARMYFAEMVLAVEYLHSYGVVHRDLKPENLLITRDGHIKITDLGLLRLGLMRPASNVYKATTEEIIKEFLDNSTSGTSYYIAPEIILKKGFGRPVDWWSSGIILYQFIVGSVPFGGRTTKEIYLKVIKDDITWDFENSPPAPDVKDIIKRLLRKNPAYRLGTGGAQEIKMHPFLSDLDLEDILSQKPEYVPQLESDMDTSCFDTRSLRYHHMVSDEEEDPSEDSEDLEYQNFTSSSQRLSNLYTGMMNNEDPKCPPSYSPGYSAETSEMQTESSISEADDDNQEHDASSILSSSSKLSGFPAQPRRTALNLRRQQNNENVQERDNRTRGSTIRRFFSSCRRRLSRAAHTIGGCFSRGNYHLTNNA